MAKNVKTINSCAREIVEVKSKFDAEYRRFSLNRKQPGRFVEFYQLLEWLHKLQDTFFIIAYTDNEGDLLPINNDENMTVAVANAQPVLRLLLERKGESILEYSGYGSSAHRRPRRPCGGVISRLLRDTADMARCPTADTVTDPSPPLLPQPSIGPPLDFRRVSAVVDVDVVPPTQRRVQLMRTADDRRPLGFFIRDAVRPGRVDQTSSGGIFISRLVPGGLAAGTGLVAVNDEVLEVNGIDVAGKTLDQVTDMMIANSACLVITIRPFNQRHNVRRRGRQSVTCSDDVNDNVVVKDVDDDEICEHLPKTAKKPAGHHVTASNKTLPIVQVADDRADWVIHA